MDYKSMRLTYQLSTYEKVKILNKLLGLYEELIVYDDLDLLLEKYTLKEILVRTRHCDFSPYDDLWRLRDGYIETLSEEQYTNELLSKKEEIECEYSMVIGK